MEKRNYYNEGNPEDVTRAALFIFLCVPAKRYLFCKPKWETVRYLWLWGPGKATGRGTDPLQPQIAPKIFLSLLVVTIQDNDIL